jgi:hypothetical protein
MILCGNGIVRQSYKTGLPQFPQQAYMIFSAWLRELPVAQPKRMTWDAVPAA